MIDKKIVSLSAHVEAKPRSSYPCPPGRRVYGDPYTMKIVFTESGEYTTDELREAFNDLGLDFGLADH